MPALEQPAPAAAEPQATIRRIAIADLREALAGGVDDLMAKRTDAVFLVILYPLIGLVIGFWAAGEGALELIFPLASGFALVGPLAAAGLYEISRQREEGRDPAPVTAYRSAIGRAGGPLLLLALVLFALFALWIGAAGGIWRAIMGTTPPDTVAGFLARVFGTGSGWALILVGNLVGALFALVAMAVSVFSLPMVIDGERNVARAIATSVRACLQNPATMIAWGVVIGLGLMLASIPAFVGLILVLPIFGHATWRLYRRTIAR